MSPKMTLLKTEMTIIIVLSIAGFNCDTISDIRSDILLRGSGEEITLEDIESTLKVIQTEKSQKEESAEAIKEDEVISTTDQPFTTTEVNKEDYTTSSDATESTTIDNFSNNESTIEPTTTTSISSSTLKEAKHIGAGGNSGVIGVEGYRDNSLRMIKLSENSESKQDKRNFEMKQSTTPSASKSSILRGWLQDTWLRPPAGFLVPLRPMALSRALAVWNDLTVEGLNVTDIVVIAYDSNGVTWRSRHNLQSASNGAGLRTVAEALSKLILKYQNVKANTTSDGTMKALMSAAKLVPYDSALFVVTDQAAGDAQRAPLALRALVEKRLKVYTIWTDPAHPSEESEQQLQGLRNVSKHTEGEVLPYSLQVMDMEMNTETAHQWEALGPQARKGRVHDIAEEEQLDILLVRRGGGEAISLGVPVENGVTSLRIYIEGLVEHAVLYPPNEAPQVDLYNETSVLAFSPQSKTEGLSPRDIHLVFPGAVLEDDMLSVLPMKPEGTDAPMPTVGVWHLSVRCDSCDFRLCVAARSHIHFYTKEKTADILNIRVVGPVASVRETVLLDEYGHELEILPFNYQPPAIAENGQELPSEDSPTELVKDIPLPKVKGSRVYAKIVGRDIRGEPFTRLSGPLSTQEIRLSRSASITFPESSNDLERAEELDSRLYRNRLQYNESTILPYNRAVSQVVNQRGTLLTTVQIGLSTRLYGAPGDTLQLHFEVTNYREQTVAFTFQAVGELRFLRGISPLSQNIVSGQTANVIVTVGITANAQPGARDLITFTAISNLEQVSISTYVYVTNPTEIINDVWAPQLRHNFQGSCIGRLGEDCAQHIWSATVIARDSNSGLLRLSSSPLGLTYDSNFIAGSREEVMAVYRATCCAPRVVVTAVDALGNANSYVVDISSYITGAGIAAITLGVFLFIAIVVLIVFLIYWCVKRRRDSKELPYTTSTSRNLS